jgi:hypothetical protein
MKVKNSTMQAFPFIEPHEDDNIKAYHPGLSLRDYFAAKSLQAIRNADWNEDMVSASDAAHIAYQDADAMMKARK